MCVYLFYSVVFLCKTVLHYAVFCCVVLWSIVTHPITDLPTHDSTIDIFSHFYSVFADDTF
eukprot:m.292365 g.292365  ORF g.292365 m.292365 type:complete len:61 (-) comp15838_c2_seq3:472-654(-)